MGHARLYLAGLDDERDSKSAAANKFDISYGGGGSSSSLSVITVFVLATFNVFYCFILTSARCLPNDLLTSDDIMDRDNDSMLGI